MNTVIPYLYRDASNYKVHGELVIEGELSPADLESIRAVLTDRLWFDPAALDLPHLGDELDGFPSDDDHEWHELVLDEANPAEEPATLSLPLLIRSLNARTRIGP